MSMLADFYRRNFKPRGKGKIKEGKKGMDNEKKRKRERFKLKKSLNFN
jgi:hypothetical protein